MLSLLLLALPLSASAKAVFAFALPVASEEINIKAKIEKNIQLHPRQWDTIPTEPYTLPMVPALTTSTPQAFVPSPDDMSTTTATPSPTPTYTYAETHNDDKNTQTHEIIAGVIGALFIGVPVLGTIIFCLCRRCRGSKEEEELETKEEEKETDGRQSLMSSRYSVEQGERERAGGRYPEVRHWV